MHPLPDVVFDYEHDMVCYDWTPLELTGGLPEGGEYDGPGVEDGFFYPAEAGLGEHTLFYHYMDENGCSATAEHNILVDPCTGVQDLDRDHRITIYPNPAENTLFIRMESPGKEKWHGKLVDIQGNTALVFEMETLSGSHELDISKLEPGLYLVVMTTSGHYAMEKILVK